MEQNQRFFIYGRKEMGVLVLLGLLVTAFAFTLGVHLGKRVSPKAGGHPVAEASGAPTMPDKVPNQQEITDQAKNVQQHAEESLGQALHEEVMKTGIKLDQSRQTELPQESVAESRPAPGKPKPKAEAAAAAAENTEHAEQADHEEHADAPKAAAPTAPAASEEHHASEPVRHAAKEEEPAPVARSKHARGKYALQVGSYPSQGEAQQYAESLAASELKAFIQSAEIKGKGKWYRVLTGSFATRQEAEKAGERLRSRRVINSFVVSKLTD